MAIPSWVGPAIQAGGEILGGIFGGSGEAKAAKAELAFARELNQNRVQWTVEDAKKAGIHPLAALGASSLGGFAMPQFVSGPGLGDSIGAGLSAIGRGVSSVYEQDEDALEREQDRRLQRELQDREHWQRSLDRTAMLNDPGRRLRGLQEELVKAQIAETMSRTMLMRQRAASIGGPQAGAVTDQYAVPLVEPVTGRVVQPGPASSAQVVADRWGDLIGEAYGISNFVEDQARSFWDWYTEPFRR